MKTLKFSTELLAHSRELSSCPQSLGFESRSLRHFLFVTPGEDPESKAKPLFLRNLKPCTPDILCMKRYYVYIMASQKNGTLYIGVTSNLIKRAYQHKTHAWANF